MQKEKESEELEALKQGQDDLQGELDQMIAQKERLAKQITEHD